MTDHRYYVAFVWMKSVSRNLKVDQDR